MGGARGRVTRGAPSGAQYGVHDKGRTLRDALRGALRGTSRGAVRGAFKGALGGHLKGRLKGSGAALSLKIRPNVSPLLFNCLGDKIQGPSWGQQKRRKPRFVAHFGLNLEAHPRWLKVALKCLMWLKKWLILSPKGPWSMTTEIVTLGRCKNTVKFYLFLHLPSAKSEGNEGMIED